MKKRLAKKWFKKAPPVGECPVAPSRHVLGLINHLRWQLRETRRHSADAVQSVKDSFWDKLQANQKHIRALTSQLDEANARVVSAKEQAARYEAELKIARVSYPS